MFPTVSGRVVPLRWSCYDMVDLALRWHGLWSVRGLGNLSAESRYKAFGRPELKRDMRNVCEIRCLIRLARLESHM
jgi:hypothetical protein